MLHEPLTEALASWEHDRLLAFMLRQQQRQQGAAAETEGRN